MERKEEEPRKDEYPQDDQLVNCLRPWNFNLLPVVRIWNGGDNTTRPLPTLPLVWLACDQK